MRIIKEQFNFKFDRKPLFQYLPTGLRSFEI